MKKSHIAILVLSLIIGGIFLLNKKAETPVDAIPTSNSQVSDPTITYLKSNIQIQPAVVVSLSDSKSFYQNQQFGFSFTYPSSWQKVTNNDVPVWGVKITSDSLGGQTNGWVFVNYYSLQQWSVVKKAYESYPSIVKVEKILNGNAYSFYKYIPGMSSSNELIIPFEKSGIVLGIQQFSYDADFDNILSSFKFTK